MRFLLLSALFVIAGDAQAWGRRGHQAICEAAIHLLEPKTFREFARGHSHSLVHACLVPDIAWRAPGPEQKNGHATHFLNVRGTPWAIGDVPLDYAVVSATLKDSQKLDQLGSSWWRAEQFLKRAVALKPEFRAGAGRDADRRRNRAAQQFLLELGLAGHFIADNANSLHCVPDYDGKAAGQEGLHDRFETQWVNSLGPELVPSLVEGARAEAALTSDLKTFVADQRAAAKLSADEFPELLAADRKSKSELSPEMKKLLLKQLARATAQTARAWQAAFDAIGTPALERIGTLRFRGDIPFVQPDYSPSRQK